MRQDVAAALWPSATASVLRAMLLSALSMSLLLGGSVHYEIHLFELKALQSSDRSLLSDGPSSHSALTFRSEARSGKPYLCHFTLGSLPCRDLHLLFFTSSLSRQICAPMRVVEGFVDLCSHPQAVQEHRELSRHRHCRSLLSVLASASSDLLSMTS
jgi:hypothetical protein